MAREIYNDTVEVYRVVMVNSQGGLYYYGPYTNQGTAGGQLTMWLKHRYYVAGYIEKSTTTWERVDGAPVEG
jgi:hypothetical protein